MGLPQSCPVPRRVSMSETTAAVRQAAAGQAVAGQALHDLEEWDEFLEGRYREGKTQEEFRQYDATATPGVAEFYRLNHENQTVAYVLGKEKQYFGLAKGKKT